MTNTDENKNADWLAALHNAFAQLPDDYTQCHEQLMEIRHLFLKEIAGVLQGRLNQHVHNLPQETFAEKQQIARTVNRDLRLLNLCLRYPETGAPAILAADFRDDAEKTSRFRFRIVESSGRQLRKSSSKSVPTLELMESPPREENLARPHPPRQYPPGPSR